MRRVSGDIDGQRRRHERPAVARGSGRSSLSELQPVSASGITGGAARAAAGLASAVAVSITDAIEGFDLREFRIDGLELLAQTLDVAVDRAVVDINVLAIGRVHQLVAVLDVAG